MDASCESLQEYIVERLSWARGSTIFQEGSLSDALYVILAGTVTVKKNCPKGLVKIASLAVGDTLGETSFFDSMAHTRLVTAIAETDVELGKLDEMRLKDEMAHLSPNQHDILEGLARRLRLTTAHAVVLTAEK